MACVMPTKVARKEVGNCPKTEAARDSPSAATPQRARNFCIMACCSGARSSMNNQLTRNDSNQMRSRRRAGLSAGEGACKRMKEGTSNSRAESLSASCKRALASASSCVRSEEHTSELQSRGHLVCRLLLEKKKTKK